MATGTSWQSSLRKTEMSLGQTRNVWLVALITSALLTGSAQGSSTLRQELSVVAGAMSQLLQSRGEDAIAVGQFTGPSHMPSSAGPVIAKTLREELEKHKVSV